MLQRELGKTGIKLPVLGFGAMELRRMDETDAMYLLGRVLDMGCAFIDTSPDYDCSEEFIGKAISHRRNEFILASKCACDIWGDAGHIFTRAQFEKNLDNSLKLLRTEHIDVWQIHCARPGDLDGPHCDAIAYMHEQKKAGKIGAVGISFKNGSVGDPLYPSGYSREGFEAYTDFGFDSIQAVYGTLTPECEEKIANAHEAGVGIIARGLLKRYTPGHENRAAMLQELCEGNSSVNELIIRHVISNENITSAIIGSSNAEHMKENIAAAEKGPLPQDLRDEIKRRLNSV
jgi:aryl-alcohol dehydrogenase-like predicted oxidoreductase